MDDRLLDGVAERQIIMSHYFYGLIHIQSRNALLIRKPYIAQNTRTANPST